MVRNIFLCLKQVYCCLTFVCVYIYLSKILIERFSTLYKTQTKDDVSL